jgi:hypothetical protein
MSEKKALRYRKWHFLDCRRLAKSFNRSTTTPKVMSPPAALSLRLVVEQRYHREHRGVDLCIKTVDISTN